MWPSETPWPAIIFFLTCATGFFIAWSQQRKNWLLAGIIVSLLLAVGGWEYERLVVTERERVTANVQDIVRKFQDRKYDEMISHISNSSRELKLLAASAYNLVKLGPDTRVTDIQVQMLPRNERAITVFRVNSTVQASSGSQRMNTMWEARWQPEPGGWKMIDIVPCDALTGKREEIPNEWRVFVNKTYPKNP